MPKHTKPEYTDAQGRRIGYMHPDDFSETLADIFGFRGWRDQLVKLTGLDRTTLNRYVRGAVPIPKYVALLVRMMANYHRNQVPIPLIDDPDPANEPTQDAA